MEGGIEMTEITCPQCTKVKPRNCYGYYQLSHAKTGNDIFSTNGCSKAELYYQIQFYLRMKELEEAEN